MRFSLVLKFILLLDEARKLLLYASPFTRIYKVFHLSYSNFLSFDPLSCLFLIVQHEEGVLITAKDVITAL